MGPCSRQKFFPVACSTFSVGGHAFEFKHATFSGNYQIRVDGEIVYKHSAWIDAGKSVDMTVSDEETGKEVHVICKAQSRGFFDAVSSLFRTIEAFTYQFMADGVPVADVKRVDLQVTDQTSRMGSMLSEEEIAKMKSGDK